MAQHRAQGRAAHSSYVGQHRAATTRVLPALVRSLLVLLGIGAVAVVVAACTGSTPQAPAPTAPQTPAVATATATVTVGSYTATATATRTAPVEPPPCLTADGMAPGQTFPCRVVGANGYDLAEPADQTYGIVPCTEEDGSAPGQSFPCRWSASAHGNGQGTDYVLWADGTQEDIPAYTN